MKWNKKKTRKRKEKEKSHTTANSNSNCLIEIANGMKCANKNEITSKEMPKKQQHTEIAIQTERWMKSKEKYQCENFNVKVLFSVLYLLLLSLERLMCLRSGFFSLLLCILYCLLFLRGFCLDHLQRNAYTMCVSVWVCVREECSFIFLPSHTVFVSVMVSKCIAKMHWFELCD